MGQVTGEAQLGRSASRRGSPTAVLVVVLSGLFTVSLTITVLSNSLDRIAGDLHSTRATVLWSITGPMLAFGVVGPAFGKAGDLWGHRRVFILGLAGAAVFAALTAVAWSAPSMIAFRILSATMGSATGPSAMAFINRMYPPSERVRPLGYWSFVTAGAPVIGVVVGAPLVALAGWRVIFIAQAPLCAAGALIAARLLPETDRQENVRFDVAGAVTLGLGASLALIGINRGNDWGWTSPQLVGCLALSAVLLGAFARVERRATEPLLPLAWLRRRNFVAPIGAQTLANFAYMGSFMLAPSLLQNGLGYSETHSGLMLIARPLAFALAASRAGYVSGRIGERNSGIAGATVVVVSMLTFASLGDASGGLVVIVALALAGVGMGLAAPAMIASVANSVDDADLGVAGAFQQLMSQLGAVLGAEVMQSVQLAGSGTGTTMADFSRAFVVAAAVGAMAVGVSSGVRRQPRVASSVLLTDA